MNIGFDAKRYFHNRTGLGNYSRDLIDSLVLLHPEDKFFLYDSKPLIDHLPANTIAVPPSDFSAIGKVIWRPYTIRRDMTKYRLDIYHGLSNELPFGKYNTGIKKVVTIHDIIFHHFPQHYKILDRWIYEKKTRHALKIADAVIATSKATADDLIKIYEADTKKIEIVYQTCGELHRRDYPDSEILNFKRQYNIPDHCFLYLSSFQTRKNHLQLLKAYTLYRGEAKLVLAGKPGETLTKCKAFITQNNLTHRVIILENLRTNELPLLYRACAYFVYPSLTEGFGIPLIEAAFAGLPMAVNDIPVFRELAPEGSLYFDAGNEKAFAQALDELTHSNRRNYASYLELFKPEVSSEKTYQIYQNIYGK